MLLKVRNLSLVYPAVTLCYKNEDQQGYKLNVLKVVKTIDRTSFVVISLRNSTSLAIGRMVQVLNKAQVQNFPKTNCARRLQKRHMGGFQLGGGESGEVVARGNL